VVDQSQQSAAATAAQSDEALTADIEELSAQAAIEESILETRDLQHVGSVNAQISDALIKDSSACDGPRVLLLRFSRPSAALRQNLLNADELSSCRAALESQGLPVELASGAKVFVRPEHYDPALTAIRLYGLTLYKNHVIVDPDLEDIVVQLAKQIHGRSFTYPKRRDLVPLGLAEWATAMDEDVIITRTFVEIRVCSSMCSEPDLGAPRTVSTTDAYSRKCHSGPARRGNSGGCKP